jgi:hypothetical protein
LRDDFSIATKETLAKRVAYRCSNPGCRQPTSGPQEDPNGTVNIGVAAHVTAASANGPRFDSAISSEERQSVDNGIWLCQNCAKLIDSDWSFFDVDLLHSWKDLAEKVAAKELSSRRALDTDSLMFSRLERLMPKLLAEMRDDLTHSPLCRQLVLLKKNWVYNADSPQFFYHYEEHPELDSEMHILENYELIADIQFNSVKRYIMSEKLVSYLLGE